MKDIAARELKGHNILAVERFWDSTFWMIEFTVLRPTAYGEPGDEMRLFLTEDGYQSALQSQQRREIKIKRYAHVIEGHILDFKPTGDVAAYNGNVSSDESHGIIERQADTLASALLMPLPQIKKCFYRLKIGRTDEQLIAEMANIFEVSKQAMQIRLKSRNLI